MGKRLVVSWVFRIFVLFYAIYLVYSQNVIQTGRI